MNPVTIASTIVYALSFFAFPWFTIGNGKSYLYILMGNGINFDFICIPILIAASFMSANSSSKSAGIMLGLGGLLLPIIRFFKIVTVDGGWLAPSPGLGMYLVIIFGIVNLVVAINSTD